MRKTASKVIAELCGDPSIEKEVNERLKTEKRRPKQTRVFVEHGDDWYEIKFNRDCTLNCAFVHHGPYGPCENGCYLPRWFRNVLSRMDDAHLVVINNKRK